MKKSLPLLVVLLVIGTLPACGGGDDASSPATTEASAAPTVAPPTGPTPTIEPVPITDEMTVFAASSLTAAFTQIGAEFEARYPGLKVNFSFGGSQDLRTQLEQGAQASIYASADVAQMNVAASSGIVTGLRRVFARNNLVIIVPEANEAGLATPQDLANDGIKIVIAGENVPVGAYTRLFLDSAVAEYGAGYKDAVLANVVSEASNVKEVASAVQLDEVDAGVVYVTDVTDAIAGDVSTIDIPDDLNQTAEYQIALTPVGGADEFAQAFIDYVFSVFGQATLASFGFGRADQ